MLLDLLHNLFNYFEGTFRFFLIIVILSLGVYFTYKLKFIQISHFRHSFDVIRLKKPDSSSSGLTSFQVFCTSMAARVGTGNIAGVAVAISLGGPGAIFWMWVTAAIGMSTALVESTLAQIYKYKNSEGNFIGGPSYYMDSGLNKRWMGMLFSFLLILSYGLAFNLVQANTISTSIKYSFNIDKIYIAIFLSLTVILVISKGISSVAKITSTVVPLMAGLYLLMSLYVVAVHIKDFPLVIWSIIKDALNFYDMIVGSSVAVISQGVVRGLFSNEAGMGSSANIAASADPIPEHPASQGFVQMLGVFFDTIVICTASAALILLTDMHKTASNGGIDLILNALTTEIGLWSSYLLTFILFLFCFTSIVANYSYAESNISFLFRGNRLIIHFFKFLVALIVSVGVFMEMPSVWKIADISVLFMSGVNLYSIWMLSDLAFSVVFDYVKQNKDGAHPTFNPNSFKELDGKEIEWSRNK